jgi:subtilisin family serine protease
MIAARREVGWDAGDATYRKAFRKQLAARVGELPWDVVQDDIQESKGRMEIFSENLLMGIINANMDVAYEKNGELSADQATGLIGMYVTITERLPLKNEMIDVYQEYIDAHKSIKPDIWSDRAVTLTGDQHLTPVTVAAWDSGTDPAVFSDCLFVNPGELFNDLDDDGNGYVDDVHGIAFDIHANRTTGMLYPLGDAADRMPQVMKHMKGFMDIQAAVDSPEATALKQHLAGLEPAEVKGFIEDLSLAGNYAHGTHVAGIMVEGNPAAEVLIARLSYDHRMIPVARTVEWGERDGQKCRDTVGYFKQHGVRVVNMSWGEAQEDAEQSLERNGIGETAEERRQIARKVFALQKEGLYEAIKNAPDILFVAAAGNADNDVEFDEYIPSSFDLPNLLVVGAVDQAGEPTSFTSSGRTVQVYANGFEVESYVPGGERMKMSGTSMASPNVANLAAKILAIDPTLSPPEVVALIKRGADKKESGGMTYLLINPRRTIVLMKSS